MSWNGNTHRTFLAIADTLIMERADDEMLHDVLAALMDHIGVPMMLAEKYRAVGAIVALFAERGVTLLPLTETTSSVDQSAWPAHLRDDAPYQKCSYCGRKTWSVEDFGSACRMTLPHRGPCTGRFGPEISYGD